MQRWERYFALPVRRGLRSSSKSFIVADPIELDAWVQSLPSQKQPAPSDAESRHLLDLVAKMEQTIAVLRSENRDLKARLGLKQQTSADPAITDARMTA